MGIPKDNNREHLKKALTQVVIDILSGQVIVVVIE